MAKYKSGNFLQFPRSAFKHLQGLKTSTKWLYVVLTELEHQYTGKNENFFYRSISMLCLDSNLGRNSVINGLKQLEQHGLIEKWMMQWKTEKTKTGFTKNHITAIRIMDLC